MDPENPWDKNYMLFPQQYIFILYYNLLVGPMNLTSIVCCIFILQQFMD